MWNLPPRVRQRGENVIDDAVFDGLRSVQPCQIDPLELVGSDVFDVPHWSSGHHHEKIAIVAFGVSHEFADLADQPLACVRFADFIEAVKDGKAAAQAIRQRLMKQEKSHA